MRQAIVADYEQVYLLPPALEDWIGPEHPARYVREFVAGQDLRALGFASPASAEGGAYYASTLLLAVWLYGYWRKLRSSRAVEDGCRNDLGLIWLCGAQAPDHNTLWRFFSAHQAALGALFKQSVQTAMRLELVGLVLQAVDGTKIQAACSGRQVWDAKFQRQLLAQLDETIAQSEAAIRAAGAPEQAPVELPSELRSQEQLRDKVRAALAEMEQTGRKHVHPHEPQARRMESDGRNRFCYNAQAVVDAQAQIIVAEAVVPQENDIGLLVPMVQAAQANTGANPCSLADGGYAASAQFAAAESTQVEVLTPLPTPWRGKEQEPFHSSQFTYEPERDVVRCPQGQELPLARQRLKKGVRWAVYRSAAVCRACPVRGLCTKDRHGRSIDIGEHHGALVRHRDKLRDPANRARLQQRARIVEPVFAQIKANGGFRRWTARGLRHARTQWSLLCLSWNLRVIFARSGRRRANPVAGGWPCVPTLT